MSLLRLRDVRLLLAGYALSALGDVLALLALTIRIHDSTGSGFAVAALLLAGTLPMLLLAPVAGWLVDRFETVRVLVLAALASAAIAAGLAVTTNLAALLAMAAGLGAAATVIRPAVFTLLPRVAGEDRLTEANSLLEIAQYGGATLGPVLAGLLSARFGTRATLLADAFTFLGLAAAVALLRTGRDPATVPGTDAAGPKGELRRGFALMSGDPVLRIALIVVGCLILALAAGNVAEVFLAKDVLQAGDGGYGAMNAAWTAGMVAGVLLVARRVRSDRLAQTLLAAAAVAGMATMAAGAAPGIVVAVAVYAVGGAANGLVNVTMRSLIQHRVPDGLRGRAYATYAGVGASADLASTGLGGALVTAFGPRVTLLACGAAALLVSVGGSVAWRRLGAAERAVTPA
jgi:MFS family permease